MPLVSIIVVFHRVSTYLGQGLRSLFAQTFRDIEIILVDNGTGTGTGTLAEFGNDPRLRLVSLPRNQGCAAGYRAGLSQARGQFIGLQGYDDLSLPRRVEAQVARLQREPRLGVVLSRAWVIDDGGVLVGREFALVNERECRIFTNYSNPGPASSFLGREEVFARFAFRSEFDTAEDFDFLSRVVDVWPICGINEDLLHYRRHSAQVTQERQAEQVLRACLIRLLAARRRSGRAEDFAAAWATLGSWVNAPPSLPVIYARFANWCLEEKFPLLAVYHARKLLAVRRDVPTMAAALRVYRDAVRIAPGEAVVLTRMFLTGPLRTHRLNSA
jgi:glycosyltransferase involved in cell wall biosynthesis